MKKLLPPLLLMLIAVLCSCTSAVKKGTSPKGYNLTEPVKKYLPDALLEISGICFGPQGNDTLYGINDEDGLLFGINLSQKKLAVSKTRFTKGGDYEDLAFYKGYWVVLKSNGTLLRFSPYTFVVADSISINKNLLPRGEYESMAVANDTLYVLCKSCPVDEPSGSTGSISAYAITETGGSFAVVRNISISLSGIAKNKAFKPSAMAMNPVSGNWFILSAVNKKLVELTRQFDLIGIHNLRSSLFTQPEGITFSTNGTMYISNEGGDETATLLQFTFSP